MRKKIVFAVALINVILFSFNEKNNIFQNISGFKKASNFCGPAFDFIYNQHSTVIVSTLNCLDPLGNFVPVAGLVEPGDVVSISASGSMCGYAGGTYEYFFNITNSNNSGSIQILDQNNNVISCQNIGTKHLFHFVFNATCATTYKIVISNSSC